MAVESMLTTTDNPYSPFDEYDKWFYWDMQAGYNTPGLLARVVITSDELSPSQQREAINDAIDEIVELNVLGVLTKVTRELVHPRDS